MSVDIEPQTTNDEMGAAGTPVSIRTAREDDPHLGVAAKRPDVTEKLICLVLLIGIAGVAGFGAAYWQAASPRTLAVCLGVGLFALGFGMTAWGKYLMPKGPFVEDRHPLGSTEAERDAMAAAIVDRGGVVVQRRKMLARDRDLRREQAECLGRAPHHRGHVRKSGRQGVLGLPGDECRPRHRCDPDGPARALAQHPVRGRHPSRQAPLP